MSRHPSYQARTGGLCVCVGFEQRVFISGDKEFRQIKEERIREVAEVLSHAEILTPLTPCSCVRLIWCLAAVIAPHIISYLQVPPLQFSTSGFTLKHRNDFELSFGGRRNKPKLLLGIYILSGERCRAAGGKFCQSEPVSPGAPCFALRLKGVACVRALQIILLYAAPQKMRRPGVCTSGGSRTSLTDSQSWQEGLFRGFPLPPFY